jgi:hypothetical protein
VVTPTVAVADVEEPVGSSSVTSAQVAAFEDTERLDRPSVSLLVVDDKAVVVDDEPQVSETATPQISAIETIERLDRPSVDSFVVYEEVVVTESEISFTESVGEEPMSDFVGELAPCNVVPMEEDMEGIVFLGADDAVMELGVAQAVDNYLVVSHDLLEEVQQDAMDDDIDMSRACRTLASPIASPQRQPAFEMVS